MARVRGVMVAVVCVLGYWAPWDLAFHLDGTGPNAHLWGVLSAALSQTGVVGIGVAFDAVLGVGIALTVGGAWLRTLGDVRERTALAAVGTLLHVAALGLLMPVSGAGFAVVLVAGLEWWSVQDERAGGAPTPREGGGAWVPAVLQEVYAWGVAGSFAVAGWGYNAGLLVRCVVVSAGVGLVVRGMMPRRAQPQVLHPED